MSQDKAKKLGRTVEDVDNWLCELKSVVNYEQPLSVVSDSDTTKSASVAGSDA